MQISPRRAGHSAAITNERREPYFGERPGGSSIAQKQLLHTRSLAPQTDPDISFLARSGVPVSILELATRLAASCGTEARQELFAMGFNRDRFWKALAADLRLPFVSSLSEAALLEHADSITVESVRQATSVMVRIGAITALAVGPGPRELMQLRLRLRDTPALAARFRIAAPETIRAFLVRKRHKALGRYATGRLAEASPALSSRRLHRGDGTSGMVGLLAAGLGLCLLAPWLVVGAISFGCSLFFINCSVWKTAAALRRPRALRLEGLATERLPTYTILIPLYREAAVVPDLIRQLARLDYPLSKLQILLLLEADDRETRAAVAQHVTGAPFEVIGVPRQGPRTKPKALTYALVFARGEFVVVYDAEDRPEPDQLRKAAAAFREQPHLGCVQARLAPDNQGSWLARMFTLEYAANFEVLLPALASWHLPVPLGGTSNHFPRAILEKVGGWDPYNVTEDADLGLRLARFGYQTATILSRTYEEAPISFRQWLPQRRRWIKGWMRLVNNIDKAKSLNELRG